MERLWGALGTKRSAKEPKRAQKEPKDILRAIFVALSVLLGRSLTVFGRAWSLLVSFCSLFVRSWGVFDRTGALLLRSCSLFVRSWGALERTGGALCVLLGALGALLELPWVTLGACTSRNHRFPLGEKQYSEMLYLCTLASLLGLLVALGALFGRS